MYGWQWLLWAYVAAGIAYWVAQTAMVVWTIRNVPSLAEIDPPEPEVWPRVSVISPAHNEGDVLEMAVRSRLQDDYPNLEIVLIDDRSTDATVQVVQELGQEDARIRPVRIDTLPPGWWGKTHALKEGFLHASGDWILLSDADVHVAPGTMCKVIAYCEGNRIDHLTVLPEADPAGICMDAIFGINIRQICNNARVWAITDPRSTASSGMGAFSLIRCSAWQGTPGLAAIGMDVTEDYAIGRMLKQSGARCAILNGAKFVGLQFYRSVKRYSVSMNRSGWAYWGKFSLPRTILMALGLLAFEAFPIILWFPLGLPYQPVVAGIALLLCVGSSAAINRWNNGHWMRSLLFPLGAVLNAYFILQAGILGVARGGVWWGGVFMPNDVLKKQHGAEPDPH